ncbi:hypothetical protein BAURA86_00563 [Brevibacterium aurantiacum]|uniref:Uncharacterized protein n=1 Tax=Brevibacterium aurantiacum TaxID=273384 RepID=A0A2H1IER7_BREAU|nr:hypothetical protein BAURA86_00563 [Brevibacterium aurantiacum]
MNRSHAFSNTATAGGYFGPNSESENAVNAVNAATSSQASAP